MIYGEKIRSLRERQGLLQKELANILSIEKTTYNEYEVEYIIIPIKHLITLCDFLNVSLDYIFSFTNIKQYKNSKKEIDFKLAGERLKEFRKANKLTQKKLASILNISFTTISSYELGVNLIATPFLYTICKKYNISADYLLGKIKEPKNF